MSERGENVKDTVILKVTKEEFKLIKGCLLTTKETFKILPFKNQDTKNKMIQIDMLLKHFSEGA